VFLLDTDVLSTLRKEKGSPAVRKWIEGLGWEALSTTVINVAEIQCGIERQVEHHPDYAQRTQAWLDTLLAVGGPRIYAMGVRAALLLARMHEAPSLRNFVMPDRKQKKPRTAADLAIAAIAIAEGAVVATGNTSHFAEIHRRFPLPGVYDPFQNLWVIAKTQDD
jgi:predicted nucleic acid-binding protein